MAQKEPKPQQVKINVDFGPPAFPLRIFFNAFVLERLPNGVLLSLGFVHGNVAPEPLSFIVALEGLIQMRDVAGSYIKGFGDVGSYQGPVIGHSRSALPTFANYLRVAMAGDNAEISLFTVLLNDLANVARAKVAAGSQVPLSQVALLHSDSLLHKQLILSLLNCV